MKKLFVLLMALSMLAQINAQEKKIIRISTDNTDLILQVAPNGRLYQSYLGDKLLNEQDINNFFVFQLQLRNGIGQTGCQVM